MYIDYSLWRPSTATLKKMGVKGVGRYIGWDGVPGYGSIGKNITKAEADSLLAAGIEIFLFFEYGAQAAANGHRQGMADGALASRQIQSLGLPEDMAVYFALDWDVPDYAPANPSPVAKLGPVADYFSAIRSQHPAYKVGVYGGYWPVSRLLTAGLADIACQTIAWSGSNIDKRAAVIQNGFGLAGGNADQDDVNVEDYGQAPRPVHAPPQKLKTVLAHDITSGSKSLADLVRANPANRIATVLRLTLENTASGCFDPRLAAYINDGKWEDHLPPKITVYFYKQVPA